MLSLLKQHFFTLSLLILLTCGTVLRFYNINWDKGHMFHPDERNIAAAVTRIQFFSHLDPEFFAYGSIPIYVYRATGDILVKLTNNASWVSDWGMIHLIGRFYSAFFSCLTILFLFILVEKMFLSRKLALLSSFLYTFTVTSIQTAHYATTENLLVLFVVLIGIMAVDLIKKPTASTYIKSGLLLGTVVAIKVSAVSYIIYYGLSHLYNLIKNKKIAVKLMVFFLLLLIFTSLIFTITSPYTFLSWDKFWESMNYESGVAKGTLPVVYTYQFNNTVPYLFQIKNFFWQMGPAFLFTIPGLLLIFFQLIKTRNFNYLLFIAFPLVYFFYLGTWHAKFIRYMLPILPFLIICAGYFLLWIYEKNKQIGYFLITISCLSTVLYSIAFCSIYIKEQSRITASKWIYAHIPAQSKILGEHWDDGLPIPLPEGSPETYQIEQLTIYEPDNAEKLAYYATELSSADYIALNSRRLYGTLIHMPDKYPLTSKYYQLLFSNKLGYEKVAEFSSYPSLFGYEINDDAAEETFQVYDHPKAIIFKNTKHFSEEELAKILQASL